LRNLFLTLIVITSFLTGLEVLFRVFDLPPSQRVARNAGQLCHQQLHEVKKGKPYVYGLKPDTSITCETEEGEIDYSTNSKALRGEEVPYEKRPDEYRILILGDSVTWGSGVQNEKTYPFLLEERLPENVTVINAATSGYSTFNQFEFLKEEAMRYQPDSVWLAFCFNDVCDPYDAFDFHTTVKFGALPKASFPHPQKGYFLYWLNSHSRLLYWVSDRLRNPKIRLGRENPRRRQKGDRPYENCIRPLLDEDSPEWQWLEGLLLDMSSFPNTHNTYSH